MPASAAEPVTRVAGRYDLLAPVGIGTTATVFRAWDTVLGVERAAKLLHAFVADDLGVVDRFLDEARTMARLDHPNIVRVVDLGLDGASHFAILEWMPGGSLASRVALEGPLAPEAALRATFQLLQALDAAHAAQVVHRDVRPANLLLARDGTVRLSDFGVARLRYRLQGPTVSGERLGTGAWSAPEQADDPRHAGPSSDLFGVGQTLRFLLTGRTPEESLDTGLPGGWAVDELIDRATLALPEQRFQTAADMAAAVAAAVDALPDAGGRRGPGRSWLASMRALRATWRPLGARGEP